MIDNLVKRTITSFFLIIILCFCLFYSDNTWKTLVIIFLFLCFFEFYNLINKIYKNKFFKSIIFFLISLYLYLFYFFLIKLKIEFSEWIILILLITCIFSDIGGYVVGKLIGGPRLTSISPNKTISGAFGSILFTVIGTSLFIIFLEKIVENLISFEFSVFNLAWLIIMSIICQSGDLLVSYLKRKAKVKDTGNILPGHGGILDRVDGILFAIPFGVLIYFFLGTSL